jgi:TPR repeat protein
LERLGALCFGSALVRDSDEICRAAELGDAFAQAWMARQTSNKKSFQWAEKSAAQGARDGLFWLRHCYRCGKGCEGDVQRAKENFLVTAELGFVYRMEQLGELLEENDRQQFVWFGKAASRKGNSSYFVSKMSDQIRNFDSGTGHTKVVFVIGRALKGHINNEKRTIFGNSY